MDGADVNGCGTGVGPEEGTGGSIDLVSGWGFESVGS